MATDIACKKSPKKSSCGTTGPLAAELCPKLPCLQPGGGGVSTSRHVSPSMAMMTDDSAITKVRRTAPRGRKDTCLETRLHALLDLEHTPHHERTLPSSCDLTLASSHKHFPLRALSLIVSGQFARTTPGGLAGGSCVSVPTHTIWFAFITPHTAALSLPHAPARGRRQTLTCSSGRWYARASGGWYARGVYPSVKYRPPGVARRAETGRPLMRSRSRRPGCGRPERISLCAAEVERPGG